MKCMLPLLMLLLLAGSHVFAQQSASIDLPLVLSSNNGDSQDLRFGVDCAATDTIDGALGESEQPPFPPLDKFYAIWVGTPIGKNWGNGLAKDYRQGDVATGSLTRIYQMQWQSGNGTSTVTVTWNLPAGVTGVLEDLVGGVVVNTAISGSGSIGVIPALGALKMTITYSSPSVVPGSVTGAASVITATGATLNGKVNPNGKTTTFIFEYGTTAAYGLSTTSTSAGTAGCLTDVSSAISSLSPNTTYHFRIVAANAAGSTQGEDNTFTTSAAVALPTVTTTIATDVSTSGAQLNGTVNPNGTETSYQFEYGPTTAYGSTTTSANAGLGTSAVPVNAVISGLAPNTTYHFRLVASNPGGGSNGADQTFTTGVVPPTVATSAATSMTATTAQLNGTVNPNNAATTYQFEYGTTTSYGSTTPSQSAGAGTSAVAVNAGLTGLTVNTTYHYRITATNAAGSVQGSDLTFTTTPNVPPSVTTLGVSDLDLTSARISGSVNPNGAPTTYYFEYGLTPSYGLVTATQNAGSGLADVSVNALLSGLTKGTYYYYCIVAQNNAGTSRGSMKTVKTYSGIGGLISNGGFEDTSWPWQFSTNGTGTFSVGAPGPGPHVAVVGVTTPGSTILLWQSGITLEAGALYRLRCKAYSTTGHDVAVSIGKETSPFTPYGLTNHLFELDTLWKAYEAYFTASGFVGTVKDARFEFSMAGFAAAGDQYFFDDVILEKVTVVAPVAVTSAATSVTTGGAQVNGSVTPNGTATTYSFEYGTTTAYGSTTSWQNAGSGSSAVAVNATLSGLTPNTTYHYRLVAQNSGGSTQGADQTFTTSALAPTAKTDSITGMSTTGAIVYGTVNPNGVVTTYFFEYGATVSYGSSTSSQSAGAGSAPVVVSATLAGLTPNTLYHFRLVATNGGGTVQGKDSTFTTKGLPPAITVIAVTNVHSTGGQLNGTVNPNGTATTYYFEYGTTTAYGSKTATQNAGAGSSALTVNAVLITLTKSTLYHYRLVAQNSGGTTMGADMTFSTTATAVSMESSVPTAFDLSQNYPNPFNPTTMIRFALPKATHVTLTLYSLLGQPVAELVNGRLDVGYHVVEVNAAMLATGTYFYRLSVGEFVGVKRMAVVR